MAKPLRLVVQCGRQAMAACTSTIVLVLILLGLSFSVAHALNAGDADSARDKVRKASKASSTGIDLVLQTCLDNAKTDEEREKCKSDAAKMHANDNKAEAKAFKQIDSLQDDEKKKGHAGTERAEVLVGGEAVVANFNTGEMPSLTYAVRNIFTDHLVTVPEIISVEYEVNLDPDIPDVFQVIGTSFDAADDFALSFTVAGFEPLIRAIPFTEDESVFVLPGLDGFNDAIAETVILPRIPVPEPSALALLATFLAFAGVGLRPRRGLFTK